MKLAQIKQAVKYVGYVLDKNSPVILTGLAVAAGVTAVVMASRTTIKATRIIDAMNAEKADDQPKMTAWEIVKEVGPSYIPVGLTMVTSATCMIASTAILSKRNAALVSMCALAANELKEHEDKVRELFGAKKAQEVRAGIEQDRINKEPDNGKIICTGGDDTLCKDHLSGQYFRSSVEKIHAAINTANEDMLNTGYVSLNDVYYLMGIEQSQIGDEQGWHVENGLIHVNYDSVLSKNNEPVLVIRFVNLPRYRFN